MSATGSVRTSGHDGRALRMRRIESLPFESEYHMPAVARPVP